MDTIIILLFLFAAALAYIMWKSAEAKPYDPKKVDLTRAYDPKHDRFSPQHAHKRLYKQSEHQKRWEPKPAYQQVDTNTRSGNDRRRHSDRRQNEGFWQYQERRIQQRRQSSDRRDMMMTTA